LLTLTNSSLCCDRSPLCGHSLRALDFSFV